LARRALDKNSSAMRLHDLFHDRKAETSRTFSAPLPPVLREPFKDIIPEHGRDAGAPESVTSRRTNAPAGRAATSICTLTRGVSERIYRSDWISPTNSLMEFTVNVRKRLDMFLEREPCFFAGLNRKTYPRPLPRIRAKSRRSRAESAIEASSPRARV